MKGNTNRVTAEVTKISIGLSDIVTKFVMMTNRRDIRKGTVNKLYRLLAKGDHFETPLMANKVNGQYRLLDGNHRIEAIKKFLDEATENGVAEPKVEVIIHFYQGLGVDEEKRMYTKWNLGTKQNTNDFIKQYWDDIPITGMISRDSAFPWKVSHVWGKTAIEFKLLFQAYLSKHLGNFNGGFSGNATEFVAQCKKLNKHDLVKIRSFLKDYIDIFGNPDKKNMHYKKPIFNSLLRIWLDNAHTMGFKPMRNAFIKVRGHSEVVRYSALGSSKEVVVQARNDLLRAINGNRKKNLFV